MADHLIISKAYLSLIESLIATLQVQLLQWTKTSEVSQKWLSKFTEVYVKMVNFEVTHLKTPKITLFCKDLYSHFALQPLSKRSSRSQIPKVFETSQLRPTSIHKHISVSSWVTPQTPSSQRKKKPTSTYYSRIMNNFLNKNTPKVSKKPLRLDENEFWLLGDDIRCIQ